MSFSMSTAVMLFLPLMMLQTLNFAYYHLNAKQTIKDVIVNFSIVYILYFVDRQFNIFAMVDLDYSTHMAFALALLAFYVAHIIPFLIAAIVTVGYAYGMIYMHYHSFLDLVATTILVGGVIALFRWAFKR